MAARPGSLFDECASFSLSAIAIELGHEVIRVADVMRSAPDEEVLARARERGLVLVTEDKRFGRMVMREAHPSSGIVLLRIPAWDLRTKQARFRELLVNHAEELSTSLTILRSSGIRLRDFRTMPRIGDR